MNFVGRLTKDAVVAKLRDGREVVNFTVAINDWYKAKRQEKGVSVTTFVNCAYWMSTASSERLKKGSLIEIHGRLRVKAYNSMSGEAKASLNCHVNNFQIHQSSKTPQVSAGEITEPADDLPF
jgi:single-strand DNA-binding protein